MAIYDSVDLGTDASVTIEWDDDCTVTIVQVRGTRCGMPQQIALDASAALQLLGALMSSKEDLQQCAGIGEGETDQL